MVCVVQHPASLLVSNSLQRDLCRCHSFCAGVTRPSLRSLLYNSATAAPGALKAEISRIAPRQKATPDRTGIVLDTSTPVRRTRRSVSAGRFRDCPTSKSHSEPDGHSIGHEHPRPTDTSQCVGRKVQKIAPRQKATPSRTGVVLDTSTSVRRTRRSVSERSSQRIGEVSGTPFLSTDTSQCKGRQLGRSPKGVYPTSYI